jgi:hypothetical protein
MSQTTRLFAICSLLLTFACSDSSDGNGSVTELDAQTTVDSSQSADASSNLVDAAVQTDLFVEELDAMIEADSAICPVCLGLQTCDERNGTCVEPDACEVNQDCLADRLCLDGLCVDGCSSTGCTGRLACDDTTQLCVEATPCDGVDGCFEGRLCVQGTCSDPCTMDAACAGQRVCDLETGLCQEPDMCSDDIDCDMGRVCSNRACIDGCTQSSPCAGQQTCVDGQCEEPDVCLSAADCAGERICALSQCTDRCSMDADCPGARRCEFETGRCLEPARCDEDSQCNPNRICAEGMCADGCLLTPCANGLSCVENRCVENTPCATDQDCLAQNVCGADQRCTPRCRENADCPGATTCNANTGRCSEPAGECLFDEQCAQDEVCRTGACVEPNCQTNSDCDGLCADNLCIDERPGICGPQALCPVGQSCGPLGSCGSTDRCTENADCSTNRPICEHGSCYGCIRDADCLGSEYCAEGRCLSVDFCTDNTECRGDNLCTDNVCAQSPCNGDRYDGPGAVSLTSAYHAGLVLCDGDIDSYSVRSQANEGLRVTLVPKRNTHQMQLELVSPNNASDVFAQSVGHDGTLQVGLVPSASPRTAQVRITGLRGANDEYDLFVESISTNDCIEDQLSTALGNDFTDTAPYLWSPSTPGFLCGGDTDTYRLQVQNGSSVTIAFDALELDGVTLLLTTLSGQILTNGVFNDDTRTLTLNHTATQTGPILVSVSLDGSRPLVSYNLTATVEASNATAQAVCSDADVISLNSLYSPPRIRPTNAFAGTCNAQSDASEQAFTFTLQSASAVEVELMSAPRDTTVYIRQTCGDANTERGCAVAEPMLTTGVLPAGTYTLFVESTESVTPSFIVRTVP